MQSATRIVVLVVLTIASSDLLGASDRLALAAQTGRGRGAAGAPVAPERLVALLPAIPGWTKGEPEGEVLNIGMTMSVARVKYEKGDLSLSLEITDTLANQQLMAPFMSNLISATVGKQKTETGWAQAVTIGGFTGAEVWDDESKAADVVVILGGRFVVKADISDVKDTSVARMAVEAVNLKALAALK